MPIPSPTFSQERIPKSSRLSIDKKPLNHYLSSGEIGRKETPRNTNENNFIKANNFMKT